MRIEVFSGSANFREVNLMEKVSKHIVEKRKHNSWFSLVSWVKISQSHFLDHFEWVLIVDSFKLNLEVYFTILSTLLNLWCKNSSSRDDICAYESLDCFSTVDQDRSELLSVLVWYLGNCLDSVNVDLCVFLKINFEEVGWEGRRRAFVEIRASMTRSKSIQHLTVNC